MSENLLLPLTASAGQKEQLMVNNPFLTPIQRGTDATVKKVFLFSLGR